MMRVLSVFASMFILAPPAIAESIAGGQSTSQTGDGGWFQQRHLEASSRYQDGLLLLTASASETRPIPASKRRELEGRKVRVPSAARRTPTPIPDRGNAQKASDDLAALYQELREDLSIVYPEGLLDEFAIDHVLERKAMVDRIDAAQARYRDVVAAFHKHFTTDTDVQGQRMYAWKLERISSARRAYEVLAGHREKLAASRKATGVWLLEKANWWLEISSDRHPDQQLEDLHMIKAVLDAGGQIVPGDAAITEMRASMDGRIAAKQDANDAKVAAARWPGRMSGFAGPGDADSLENAVKTYLANDRNWGKSTARDYTILKLAIKGDWSPAEHDVWGNILSWRLPVWLAVTYPKLKERGIAQVFDLSMVSKKGPANNSNKKPPFDGPWVGNSFYMKLDKLP